MKAVFSTVLVLVVAVGLQACSSDLLCEEPQAYQSSVTGKRIESPEGLDTLAEYKELKIPAATPRTGEKQVGCVDKPPSFFTQ